MTFKCSKIRGIDKSVCTAEQKIAYNYAARYVDIGKKIFNADVPEFVKNEGYFQLEKLVLNDIKSNESLCKYNIDAIIIAFRQGFRNYCNNFFIALNYESIGEYFKIPYEYEIV